MSPRIIMVGIAAIVLAAACQTRDHAATVTFPSSGTAAPRTLLVELALLTTGSPPSETSLTAWTRETTDEVIDELLHDPRFLKRITKVFLWDRDQYLGIARYNRQPGWILKKTAGAQPIYYTREPCDAASAVNVAPWWDRRHTVKICPDSYRPTVLWMNADRACSGLGAQPPFDATKTCGCGPNLMRCTPDNETFLEFKRQFIAEIEDTVADVVDRDLPLATAYLQNATVRKPLVELQYQIWRAERGEIQALPDVLASWPAKGKLAPRYEDEPGDHAGIATAVGTSFSFGGQRAWMRALQQSLWCVSFDNSHVEAKTLFDALRTSNGNLRGGTGWKSLAAHPVCGHCHARMDYGWQFFIGYPDNRIATHFVPPKGKFAAGLHMIDTDKNVADAHTTLGKLYVNDISDYRGERLRTPLEYTKWAIEQPEFGACQASRVVEEVFGRDATSEDREAIADVFESTKKFRPMMREALRRYVQRKLAGSVAPTALAAEPTFLAARPTDTAATPDAMIAVMPQVRALLERHCLDCHDDADSDPNRNLDMPSLSRERMMLMLGYVGDRRMPKTTAGLSPAERKQLLEALVSNVWQADGDRLAAFRFYDEGLISSTVQLPDAALSLVYQRSGEVPKTPTSPMIEVTLPAKEVQYTPGFAAQMAFEALRACKAAHAQGLAACVERATDIENMVRP